MKEKSSEKSFNFNPYDLSEIAKLRNEELHNARISKNNNLGFQRLPFESEALVSAYDVSRNRKESD